MTRLFSCGITLGVCIAATIAYPSNGAASDTLPTLAVAMHDYAALSNETLIGAEQAVTRLFRKARINVEWKEPFREPVSIHVHVLSPTMTMRAKTDPGVLGLATVGSRMVYVLYPRVAETSRRMNVNVQQLLGYVIAHEIGHLLLRGRGHSDTGLMQGELNVGLAARGALSFTYVDITSMRHSELLR